MQKAVKHQNAHFIVERAAGLLRVATRDGGRDGDVAKIRTVARRRMPTAGRPFATARCAFFCCDGFRWKREDVRGLGFAAIEAIPARYLRVRHQAYSCCSGRNAQKPGDASKELLQRGRSNGYTSLAVDYHGLGTTPRCRGGRIRGNDCWPRNDCRAARRRILRRP